MAACEWGQRAWVHDPAGSKLDGRTKEAQWVSFDHESTAHHIYWPKKGKVSIEQSIKFKHDHILTITPPTPEDVLSDSPITSTPSPT